MLSFHNDPKIYKFYHKRVKAHYEADEIVKGIYWEKGKGCAVGCTVHSSEYSLYPSELNIPLMLARLEDRIFEGLDNDIAKEFPLRFIKAAWNFEKNCGRDLSKIGWQFLYWIITTQIPQNDITKQVASVLQNSMNEKSINKNTATYAAAAHAVVVAAMAHAAAADAYAAAATTADATATAADAAAATAAYAADAAYAAAIAVAAATAADAAVVAAAASNIMVEDFSYKKMANKLIELMEVA